MPLACAVELDQNARADDALHRNCRSLIARDPTRSATSHHEEVCHAKTFYSETFYSETFYSETFYSETFYSETFYSETSYAKIFYFKVCDENIRIGRSA
jgi:hypothetical protein